MLRNYKPYFWAFWLLLYLSIGAVIADNSDTNYTTITLQPGQRYTLAIPLGHVGFLEVQNQGIDAVASAVNEEGDVISRSATWRGSVGRYVLRLVNEEGDTAASVVLESYEKFVPAGEVKFRWVLSRPGTQSFHVLSSMALGAEQHLSGGVRSNSLAIDYYEAALSSIKKGVHTDWLGDVHFELGNLYENRSKLTKAIEHFTSAIIGYEARHDLLGKAASHNALGLTQNETGEVWLALKEFELALDIYLSIDGGFYIGQVLNNIALLHSQVGDYSKARALHTQALPWYVGNANISAEEIRRLSPQEIAVGGQLAEIVVTLTNLARVTEKLGEIDKANAIWLDAIRLGQYAHETNRIAFAQLGLGQMLVRQGRLEEALTYFETTVEINDGLENGYWNGATLMAIGWVHAATGFNDKAVEYYQRALRLVGDEAQKIRATIISHMAKANWELGNIGLANNQFIEAHTISLKTEQLSFKTIILSEHGLLLYELGEQQLAINHQQQAIKTLNKAGYVRESARSRSRLGELLLYEGRLTEAEHELESALKGHRLVSDRLYELNTLTLLSQTRTGMAALITAKQATELAMKIRLQNASPVIQEAFMNKYQGTFDRYIELLEVVGDKATIAKLNEQMRIQSLEELVIDTKPVDERPGRIIR